MRCSSVAQSPTVARGKAVATGAGAMFGLAPEIALVVAILWLVVALLTRYVSVASMVAALAFVVSAILKNRGDPYASRIYVAKRSCTIR